MKFEVRSEVKLPRSFHRALRYAYRRNLSVFGKPPSALSVVVCHTAAEWRRDSRYRYIPFARGIVMRDGTMVVKSAVLSEMGADDYRRLLVHEMNHVFWTKCLKRGRDLWAPIWLVEALACDLADGSYLLSRKTLARCLKDAPRRGLLPYRASGGNMSDRKSIVFSYSLWTWFLRYLRVRNRQGVQKLLAGIARTSGKRSFERQFNRVFGAGTEELFRAFKLSLSQEFGSAR